MIGPTAEYAIHRLWFRPFETSPGRSDEHFVDQVDVKVTQGYVGYREYLDHTTFQLSRAGREIREKNSGVPRTPV